jgi:hypothetical protein
MNMIIFANILSLGLGLYILAGLLFAIPFILRGVNRLDPSAREGSWGFRLIVFPGVVALWPLLALRWRRGQGPPQENNAHRRAARGGSV